MPYMHPCSTPFCPGGSNQPGTPCPECVERIRRNNQDTGHDKHRENADRYQHRHGKQKKEKEA